MVTSRSRPELPSEESASGVRIRRIPLPSRTANGWARYAVASIPETRRWGPHSGSDPRTVLCIHPPRRRRCTLRGATVGRIASHLPLPHLGEAPWVGPVALATRSLADHAFAASEEIREVAENLGRGRPVEALTNGVDTARFRPSGERRRKGAPTLVVPRRLVPKNGVEYLVRALPEIRRLVPGVRARLIGDGPERGRLEMLARELQVEESIEFVGPARTGRCRSCSARATLPYSRR